MQNSSQMVDEAARFVLKRGSCAVLDTERDDGTDPKNGIVQECQPDGLAQGTVAKSHGKRGSPRTSEDSEPSQQQGRGI